MVPVSTSFSPMRMLSVSPMLSPIAIFRWLKRSTRLQQCNRPFSPVWHAVSVRWDTQLGCASLCGYARRLKNAW
jgi:hypothetical protein